MKRLLSMHACALALLSAAILPVQAAAPALAAVPSAPSGGIADVMTALADRSDAVWNRRDATAMAALYALDATTTIGRDIRLKGRPEIQAHFTRSFAGLPAGMTHRTVVQRIEPLGDMFAVDSQVAIEMPDGAGGKRVLREFFTFALVRPVAGGWEFLAVRATPLGAAPRA
ncbi:SgcJ/EcaC family oxidoreductase [Massilia sp. IC2-476]|uniref:YybH family protein n=1 Tax=Massilia sp. IC2-476 TaxID=2887199 RepID=UPI001D0FED05|nr:SgcJ/EcaC family oxidoreductase [Massilia sp. IC2-476]MCC2973421.1 SgcJ/EcaC family oxidoreductase [Massilia sp. IC2-476]